MQSQNYEEWKAKLDLKTCFPCRFLHGKVFEKREWYDVEPPLHERCRCVIEPLRAEYAGFATKDGKDGADYWLTYARMLPDYYITREEADHLGWKRGSDLAKVAPGKMLEGGQYYNIDGHLPDAPGRIWYEADINYKGGHRNSERILFSNDGLIFATYDHYTTFCEIVMP